MSPEKRTKAQLVVLSAPSGGGKTTLCRMLLDEFPQFKLSISATTRPKRSGEQQGVHYHFLSEAEFKQKIASDEFIEWAVVHGHHYGTLRKSVEAQLARGEIVLFDIDVQGARSLRNIYGKRVLLIFIHPPSLEELKKRLKSRKKDSAATIERRLQNAYNELEWSKIFDFQITNDDLNRSYHQLKEIVQKQCQ